MSFRSVRILLPFLWNATPQAPLRIILSLCALLLSKILLLAVPFFYREVVNTFEAAYTSLSFTLWILIGYGTARFLSTLFSEARDALFIPIEQTAIRNLALTIFKHLHELSLRFHLDRKTGSLTQTLERGTRAIETFFRFFVFNLCPTLLELILVISIVGVCYRVVFSIIMILTLGGYVWVTFKITQWRLPFMQAMIGASNAGGATAIDSLINYATVKYFGHEQEEARRYDESLAIYQTKAERNKFSLCVLNIAQGAVLALGTIAIMGVAALQVLSHTMTVGDFVLITSFILQVYMPLHVLGFAYRETKQALLDMDGLFDLLHIPQEVQDIPNAPDFVFRQGAIEFRNVSFSYQPDRLILDNVSFKLKPAQTLAIVGPSGAGKSTLVSLLFRFFEPTAGEIFIDHQDIREVSQGSLRKFMGIVPQDTPLFNDTIFYNIAYGNLKAPPEAVFAAARHAEIDKFISKLPDKYETIVGERGLKLSGGEKQRIALARVFLKNPKIFIFDEATSSLDTQTEKAIQENLRLLSSGHTTLIIAHRLSTITHADHILVLEHGRVVEEGTHETLLCAGGLYATLWAKQHKKKTEETTEVTAFF